MAAPTQEDIEKLYKNLANIPIDSDKINEAANILKEKLDNNESYLCLCATNEHVDTINEKLIELFNIKSEIIYAQDTEQRRKTKSSNKPKKKKKTSETAGLEEMLTIGINAHQEQKM